MIIVTGAAGFIGSALTGRLAGLGYGPVVAVDDFHRKDKDKNLEGKHIALKIDREKFLPWLKQHHETVQFVFHIGARTDTSEFNPEILDHLNLYYSQEVWNLCCEYSIPLIYASSAATYGNGEHGFHDGFDGIETLEPLNPYGWSKHKFDLWVRDQKEHPPFWAGFKFFNVYGPNEYHKHRMASVVYHAFHQIRDTGKVKLFKSHKEGFKDGEQLRDFIYVKDVLDVMLYFMEHRKFPDLYNLGTGVARSFYDLASATFNSLKKPIDIEFINIPEDIREKYQYYTCADMERIRDAGYNKEFTSLENGIDEYVTEYLMKDKYL